jgi:hypothetical protein
MIPKTATMLSACSAQINAQGAAAEQQNDCDQKAQLQHNEKK